MLFHHSRPDTHVSADRARHLQIWVVSQAQNRQQVRVGLKPLIFQLRVQHPNQRPLVCSQLVVGNLPTCSTHSLAKNVKFIAKAAAPHLQPQDSLLRGNVRWAVAFGSLNSDAAVVFDNQGLYQTGALTHRDSEKQGL